MLAAESYWILRYAQNADRLGSTFRRRHFAGYFKIARLPPPTVFSSSVRRDIPDVEKCVDQTTSIPSSRKQIEG